MHVLTHHTNAAEEHRGFRRHVGRSEHSHSKTVKGDLRPAGIDGAKRINECHEWTSEYHTCHPVRFTVSA